MIGKKPVFILLFVSLLLFTAAPALAEGVSRVLLVGCDRFVSLSDTTPSSANNVADMANLLPNCVTGCVRVIARTNDISSRESLEDLILTTFSDANEDDTSFFYISTHGVRSADTDAAKAAESGPVAGSGTNGTEHGDISSDVRLILSDGTSEDSIGASELKEIFDRVPGKKVLILDSCHSGALIGKGMEKRITNLFASPEYTVLCSCGGEEESWFWSGANDHVTGAGYFSKAMQTALDPAFGAAADFNRDNSVSLSELKRCLTSIHGVSTVQTYPEESDAALFVYDPLYKPALHDVSGITFEEGALSSMSPTLRFSFTVHSPIPLFYQLIYHKSGQWNFASAERIPDWESSADTSGMLSPGTKQRTVSIAPPGENTSGYAMLQMISMSDAVPSLLASHLLCIPPSAGDPGLSVEVGGAFSPAKGEEMCFTVRHAFPCEMTVSILDDKGRPVRYLAVNEATRPQKASPEGSYCCWSGRLQDGSVAPPGQYRIRVQTTIGSVPYETISEAFELRG